jgi:uncharacterized protein (DUF952 family)
MEHIVHICRLEDWQVAQNEGEYRADSLETEGFIHCSKPTQVIRVANHYFSDAQDLLLLWIDSTKLQAELRWEASGGELYPHIYGALNLEAILAAKRFDPDPDGVFRLLLEI